MDTKSILFNVAKDLLSKKSIESITVQEILDTAKVSRSTFYRFFRDKYDIVCELYKETFSEDYLKTFDGGNADDFYRSIFMFARDNFLLFTNALQSNGQNSFIDWLNDYLKQIYEQKYLEIRGEMPDAEMAFKISVIVEANNYAFASWVKKGCIEPVDDVCRWIQDVIPNIYQVTSNDRPKIE